MSLVAKRQPSAIGPRQVVDDRQPQSGSRCVLVRPSAALHDLVVPIGGQARPIVLDHHDHLAETAGPGRDPHPR